MTPEFKARWITDLRKYPKTRSYLKNSTGYCCLGVACLTLGAKFEERFELGEWRPTLNGINLAEGQALTPCTLEQIGLAMSNQNTLIDLNDRSDTFDPVIEWIEEHL